MDWVITRSSGNIIQGRTISDRYISEHCSVLCSLSAPRPLPTVKHISFRKLTTLDLNKFKDDYIARSNLSRDDDPEKLVDLYNNTSRLLLGRHAQITSKKVLFRPNVLRKAERKWRSTRCSLTSFLLKKSRNYVTFLSNEQGSA